MKRSKRPKEVTAEDYCFVCKDGGKLLICEYRVCLKAYHPQCVGKDESFLETGECWTCSWHTCFICHKSSEFQCFCCPNSVCRSCIGATDFVQLRKAKGFCSDCLKLLMLAEENAVVDSDGVKLDFGDIETKEFLFKDYWDIIKEQEKLSMEDLHEAETLLKEGENFKSDCKTGQIMQDEGELTSDADDMNKDFVDSMPFSEGKVFRNRRKGSVKRFRFMKRDMRGWGSVDLIEFLTSLGKDTSEPLKQWDVCEIIENYVHEKNLLHNNRKKKTVVCDDKLRSLFRKKTVRLVKIYNLLEGHFAANVDSDDSDLESEKDSEHVTQKKLRWTYSETERRNKGEKVHEPPKTLHASIVDKNIKLVYLRRSLLKELLKNPETFERKVIGCFVRVKTDPKDFDFSPNKLYMIRQVSGIKNASDQYMVGEMSTSIVLRVSNIWKDVRISMLSDDDFEEEECEDLRQLVKKGLFRRPTVVEFEEKVRSVHADIMSHWIRREIAVLQRQIDRSNEKGWHREKFEYIEKRALLQTEGEQLRLLKEIPKVIPHIEDSDDVPNPQINFQMENEGNEAAFPKHAINDEGISHTEKIPCIEGQSKSADVKKHFPSTLLGNEAAFPKHAINDEGISHTEIVPCIEGHPKSADVKKHFPSTLLGNEAAFPKPAMNGISHTEIVPCIEGLPMSADVKKHFPSTLLGNEAAFPKHAMNDEGISHTEIVPCIEGQAKSADVKKGYEGITIIEIDEDDEPPEAMAKVLRVSCVPEKMSKAFGESEQVWYYLDPLGRKQGPFAMSSLRYWKREGYFNDGFRVWSIGQSQKDAILLKEALLLTKQ